jgi:threonyl-tRNA synthetase
MDYCRSVHKQLRAAGIRAEIDDRNEKIGKKIRDNEVKKIPLMLVVGEKEEAENKVAVRQHGKGDVGVFGIDEFIKFVNETIQNDFKNN